MSENNESKKWTWPAGVQSITWDGIGRLGVGSDNRLYWDGKPVVTQSRLGLTTWQKIGAGGTVFAVVLGGFLALLQIIDWFNKPGVTQ